MLRSSTQVTRRSMERRSRLSSWEAGVIPQLDPSQERTIEDDRFLSISKYETTQEQSKRIPSSPDSWPTLIADQLGSLDPSDLLISVDNSLKSIPLSQSYLTNRSNRLNSNREGNSSRE